ncbi:MAG: acetate--CoA ligase [Saprospiraceae bacterium]|nr:acetate--CoA ligase [Saprospiraceae bacterium]
MRNISTSFEDYDRIYRQSVEQPEAFWAGIASEFYWRKKWDKVLEWDFTKPEVNWFQGGKLNITENCLDRHLATRANQTAIIWEPNDPKSSAKHITYKALHSEVCKVANMLKANGIKKGDRVCIYMPMVPELAYAVLACARIGAIHSVVFAGFSSASLATRINDADCKMLLTSDGSFRGAKTIALKEICDVALEECPSIERVITLKVIDSPVEMKADRDIWWHEALSQVDDDCPAEEMDAEDPLFILYTSGSTGSPKGMVHSTGGYMVYTTYTFLNAFQYEEGDIYWCTADIGWITGHSYIVYGPLAAGATTVMFEGVPSYPDFGRFWEICEKHKVNQFYTAPTAIRALAKHPTELVTKYDLSALKVLGTVGEPINEEAWHWYNEHVGKKNCPIIDTWWQTETGGFMISPIAGQTPLVPTYATQPMPGILPAIMDENGEEIKDIEAQGRLAIKFPWPSIARTIWGNHERYKNTYFSAFPNMYFPGDGCLRDNNGNYRITGRVDDVVIVSGHNLGTAPIENAINEHVNVAESAVVGFPHDVKGNALFAFVITKGENIDSTRLTDEIRTIVSEKIGPIAKPDHIQLVPGLPKTRSGKIMRRILRKIASNDTSNLGDTSTLLNPEVVEAIMEQVKG